MDENPTDSHSPSLDTLFHLERETGPWWRPEELESILRHQLESPLLFDLSRLDSRETNCLYELGSSEATPLRNFGDLLTHPFPPLQLLILTKEFAKASDSPPQRLLPGEIATVLYYGAIVAALLRHGQSISNLSRAALLDGVQWALRQAWLDPRCRSLFSESLNRI